MINAVLVGVSLLVGLLLGGFYFGGLQFTVHRLPKTANPGLWMLGSFVIRTSIILLGFYVFSNGQWERILVCLVGFLVARTLILRHVTDANEISAVVKLHAPQTLVESQRNKNGNR